MPKKRQGGLLSGWSAAEQAAFRRRLEQENEALWEDRKRAVEDAKETAEVAVKGLENVASALVSSDLLKHARRGRKFFHHGRKAGAVAKAIDNALDELGIQASAADIWKQIDRWCRQGAPQTEDIDEVEEGPGEAGAKICTTTGRSTSWRAFENRVVERKKLHRRNI